MASAPRYRGRFAPTPSGPLHLGSLVAALGSYLDAKAGNGEWLVRIDDVDTPRVMAGADQLILQQLTAHGLLWDGPVVYQSERSALYQAALDKLTASGDTYLCHCSRKKIQASGGHHRSTCQTPKSIHSEASKPVAIRFKNDHPVAEFHDAWLGEVTVPADFAADDFVLKRRDGLFAYQLAAVVDDIDQGITDIVRGSDLLHPSAWQMTLWQRFGEPQPRLCHLPLAVQADGRKLSKQNHAPALSLEHPEQQLRQAMQLLQLPTPTEPLSVRELLEFAQRQWPVN